TSYEDPVETFDVNVMGTVQVLEAARRCDSVQALIAVTSDKSYKNQNWVWGYRETDELGGHDPYSASKACAEHVISCYMGKSFQTTANRGKNLPIASVRAGNVIGGGDWAVNRIIPDAMRAISSNQDIVIRSPNATRPWQHVLEPLSGYLWLGSLLANNDERYASEWNFGPLDTEIWTVKQIVEAIYERWPTQHSKLKIEEDHSGAESQLLRLDCAKAHHSLDWHALWSVPETLDNIVEWYKHYYENPEADMYPILIRQIERYTASAQQQGLKWTSATS
ncbi:MAG: CDP-glucose 4,6-dehydratase, partial [Chromatiales bacterium]|nr:CDP-glucose 4,6-dehydratase [Chromatiales bacterium]